MVIESYRLVLGVNGSTLEAIGTQSVVWVFTRLLGKCDLETRRSASGNEINEEKTYLLLIENKSKTF